MAKRTKRPERIDLRKLDADTRERLNGRSVVITLQGLSLGWTAENIEDCGAARWTHWLREPGAYVVYGEDYFVEVTFNNDQKIYGMLGSGSGIILEMLKDKADLLKPNDGMMRFVRMDEVEFIKLCEPFEAKERAENRRRWREEKAELKKQRDEEQQRIIAQEKAQDEARQAAQELERQNKIGSYPLMIHVDAFLKRLDELPAEEVKGDREQKLVALYGKLKQVLESNGQLSLEERELLGDHYRQSAEFDAVLKLWNDKIAKAKADPTLDEQQRKLTIGHLMAMMNKALQRLQED